MTPKLTRLAPLLLSLPLALASHADDLYVRSGAQAAELKLSNITVRQVKDGELYYTINTREAHRNIADISRLEINGEQKFNDAEKAFAEARAAKDEAVAKSKYADAVTGYTSTLGSTNKPWMKDYASIRMQTAAPRSGRFDAAVTAWKAMVDKDPVSAVKSKPSLEGIDPKSQYLAAAARELTSFVNSTTKPDAKRAFLDLLGDVQTVMGDAEGAVKTAEQRVALGGTPEEVAELAIKLAAIDVANKKYDAALERIAKANLAALPDNARGDAAFLTAESKAGKAGASPAPDQLKDIAIDYMRVVAGYPSNANTAQALLKVAEIHESLKEPETAAKIYQQVTREHPNTPAAQAAQTALQRLNKTAAR
jgi:tetratricopeptide (TPR) repeat protein